jgi:DNA-damage-inducible protein D
MCLKYGGNISYGFARIKSKGDAVLFGGITTQGMKQKLGVPDKRPLADFLPTVTITGKAFANALTEQNVIGKNLRGESPIGQEHEASNRAVRSAMLERGIKPESLPPAEDIKRVESRVKSENKKLPKQTKKL